MIPFLRKQDDIRFHLIGKLVFLCLFTHSTLQAQFYSFRNYTTEHGLPQNQIQSICQDSYGYIWFGTNGRGIAKFDGLKFMSYSIKDGLVDDKVSIIFEDSRKNLWIGTNNGLSKLKIDKLNAGNGVEFVNIRKEYGLANDHVTSIIEDKRGKIWCGTTDGLSKIELGDSNENIMISNITVNDGLCDNRVTSILEDTNGDLWVGHENGCLTRISFNNKDQSTFSIITYNLNNDFGEYPIRGIIEDKERNIWIAFYGRGMIKFNSKDINVNDITDINVDNGLSSNVVQRVNLDRNDNIWIAQWGGGISKISSNANIRNVYNIENFGIENGLNNNNMSAILEDLEGNQWFGSYGGGVSKLVSQTYKMFTFKDGLDDMFIWSVFEDSKGNIWAGTNKEGISIIPRNEISNTGNRAVNIQTRDGLISNVYVHFINEDTDGNIWIGTQEGLSIVNINNKEWTSQIRNISTKIGLNNYRLQGMLEDSKGNLWIGSRHNGVYQTNREALLAGNFEYLNINTKNGLIHNIIYSIVEDQNGDIWFATGGGITKYDGQNFENFSVKSGLVHGDVRNILIDTQGNLLFGTGGGISIFDLENKTFTNLTTKDGLSSDRLYLMHFDEVEEGILWIGTNIGIDRFDYGKYVETGEKDFYHLTHLDGFVEIETNTNAVCQDRNGNLWFGTINGLIQYNPSFQKPQNELEPQTHITGMKLARKDTYLVNNTSLPYYLNTISFNYVGISHTLPEKVRYQYQLEGFEDSWSEVTKDRFVSYGNLSPDSYTFKVKACNNDGVWNKEPTTFSFTITPAFWQTWWFYLLCIVTGSGGLYLFVKVRENNLRRAKAILEERVQLRTVEIARQKEEIEAKNKKLWQMNIAVNKDKEEVEKAKEIIQEQNTHITDSINYAQNIQKAILPPLSMLDKNFKESFVLYRPKDVVSGDFYWFHQKGDDLFIASVDCTGHGVPGAFMSMIGNDLLNQNIIEKNLDNPGEILNNMHAGVQFALRQKGGTALASDGMDMALCKFDLKKNTVQFSGAHRSLFKVNANGSVELEVVKANRIGIGGIEFIERDFTNHEIKVEPNDTFYLFSDGITDQFGGPKWKKYSTKRFREFICSINKLSMADQLAAINKELDDWQGDLEQTDDMTLIGLRV